MADGKGNTENQDYHFDPVKMGKLFQMVETIHDDVQELKRVQNEHVKIVAPIPKSIDALNIKVGIQNGRVTKLEHWRIYLTGIFAAAIFFLKKYGVL